MNTPEQQDIEQFISDTEISSPVTENSTSVKPFEDFTELELREWNNVFRTNQSYINPTPIILEMDLIVDKLEVVLSSTYRNDLNIRMSDLQDKLVEAYDR
jgi:hypothetical protein